ncbi:MAG: hypothetical protein ACI8XD_001636 [Thermoproteota archaeon]
MAQIDDDSSRSVMIGQDRAEQRTGRSHVATQRYARCDDLAMLVNSAVHLSPNGSGFHLGVINKPMAANQMPTRLCHSDSTGARCPKPQHLAASLEVLVAYEASLCMRYEGSISNCSIAKAPVKATAAALARSSTWRRGRS